MGEKSEPKKTVYRKGANWSWTMFIFKEENCVGSWFFVDRVPRGIHDFKE
jgi:hypothetical protein